MKVNFPSIPSANARRAAGILLLCSLIPGEALACACGCSVFDVGTTSLLPKEGDHGGVVYFEWDHSNQNQNWSGTAKAPAANSRPTSAFDRLVRRGHELHDQPRLGLGVRIPSANRAFTTDTSSHQHAADIQTFNASIVGDIELTGMYTGFSKDMSKGLIFGVKLPTGNYTVPNFDRDTQIGTGSTDLILGGFWRGMITGDNAWQYFSQIKYVQPVLTSSTAAWGLQARRIDRRRGGHYLQQLVSRWAIR